MDFPTKQQMFEPLTVWKSVWIATKQQMFGSLTIDDGPSPLMSDGRVVTEFLLTLVSYLISWKCLLFEDIAHYGFISTVPGFTWLWPMIFKSIFWKEKFYCSNLALSQHLNTLQLAYIQAYLLKSFKWVEWMEILCRHLLYKAMLCGANLKFEEV